MKKILSLLFLSSSLFSMELDIVRYNTKVAAVKSMHKNMHIESKMEVDPIRFNSKKMLIEQGSVFVPNRLGDVKLSHGKKGFCVEQNNKKHIIQKYFTDPMVRNVTKDQLKRFLEVGYLSLNQMDNGEFSLKANGRINGGGPLLGVAAYWITKTICYAVPLAAISTITVATGGAVGAAVSVGTTVAGGTVAGTAAVTTTAAVVGTTAGTVVGTAAAGAALGTGAGIAASAITGAGLAAEATLVTAAAVTTVAGTGAAASVGTAAACVLAVESLSTAVGTFFGMLPTP